MNNEEKLEKLKQELLKNLNCPLKKIAKNLVFGNGNPNAKIMFIGEAPGAKEDILGKTFVGNSGMELNRLLESINLRIKDCYVGNILKYRPPKNRDPNPEEIKTHTPYLIKQIKIIKPIIIATLGTYATKFVLGGFKQENMEKNQGIMQLHGKPKKLNFKDGYSIIVVPIYHPAAMLHRPEYRKPTENDFKIMQKIIIQNRKQL